MSKKDIFKNKTFKRLVNMQPQRSQDFFLIGGCKDDPCIESYNISELIGMAHGRYEEFYLATGKNSLETTPLYKIDAPTAIHCVINVYLNSVPLDKLQKFLDSLTHLKEKPAAIRIYAWETVNILYQRIASPLMPCDTAYELYTSHMARTIFPKLGCVRDPDFNYYDWKLETE